MSSLEDDKKLFTAINAIIAPYGCVAFGIGPEAVAVMGDGRVVSESILVRFPRDPSPELITTVSTAITNRVRGITRVVQDVVSVPQQLTVYSDLVVLAKAGQFDVIVHGCNCFCAMGAGIAQQIKGAFPAAYDADRQTNRGDRSKLGTCTVASCPIPSGIVEVVNAYTQYHWKEPEGEVLADYPAIRSCLAWLRKNYLGKRIGMPRIGAGLARGDWNIIGMAICEEFRGEDVFVVVRS